jgi:hypothetical protein
MVTVKKFYLYPGHAVRVFQRVVREHAALGHQLRSLSKGYFCGTGVTLRFEFAESPGTAVHQLTYFHGQRRGESDPAFQGWRVAAMLPMRAWWIPLGHFYHLKRERENVAGQSISGITTG